MQEPEPNTERTYRGGATRKLTHEQVTAALESVGGIITAAAHKLGVHRATIYNYLNDFPELKAVRSDIEEQTKDMAEGKILTAIRDGQMDTVRWYADRKMRERGYGHRQEHSGPNGGPIPIESPTIDVTKLSNDALRELRAAMISPDVADAE